MIPDEQNVAIALVYALFFFLFLLFSLQVSSGISNSVTKEKKR